MSVAVDFFTAAPFLFTLLAVILASIYFKLRPKGVKHAAKEVKDEAAVESLNSKQEDAGNATSGEKKGEALPNAEQGQAVKEEKLSGKNKKEEEVKKAAKELVEEIGADERSIVKENEREENVADEKEVPTKEKRDGSEAAEIKKDRKVDEDIVVSDKPKEADTDSKDLGDLSFKGGEFTFNFKPIKPVNFNIPHGLKSTKEEHEEEQRAEE